MTRPEIRPVTPVRPAAPYVGGKRNLASTLVRRIEAIPHTTYAEPFVGMGGVFLRRRQAPAAEVINDASRDVATFFRVLQRHYDAFSNELRFTFTSRAEFDRLMDVDPSTLTDLERAIRFLYLQRTAFGGKVAGRSFGVSPGTSGRFDVAKLGEILAALNERLAGVVIENLDWSAFLDRYDRPGTLFYIDPPYWGAEDYYGAALFARQDFERLAVALRRLEGRFLLSLNDVPQVRELFADFATEPVRVTYSVSNGAPKPMGELIITGSAA